MDLTRLYAASGILALFAVLLIIVKKYMTDFQDDVKLLRYKKRITLMQFTFILYIAIALLLFNI